MKKKEWQVPLLRTLKATETAELVCTSGSIPDVGCVTGGGGGA